MSYSDDTIAHTWGYPDAPVSRPPVFDHEWWEFEPSEKFLYQRFREKSRYYRQVRVSVTRPDYGGYRIEYRGIAK